MREAAELREPTEQYYAQPLEVSLINVKVQASIKFELYSLSFKKIGSCSIIVLTQGASQKVKTDDVFSKSGN